LRDFAFSRGNNNSYDKSALSPTELLRTENTFQRCIDYVDIAGLSRSHSLSTPGNIVARNGDTLLPFSATLVARQAEAIVADNMATLLPETATKLPETAT